MGDVRMSDSAAAPIISHFSELSAELDHTRFTMLSHATSVDNACGEFRSSAEDGTDAFHMSWRESLGVIGTTAALIAGNTNVFHVELKRLDEDLSHLPTI